MPEWWQIWDCDGVLTRYWDRCDADTKDDLWTSLQLLREYGNRCPSTISEALGHEYKLFSLKAKSSQKVRIRMIYFFASAVRRRIIFVDVIEKKKRALEPADLKAALKRKADVETGMLNAKAFERRPNPKPAS